MNTQTNPVLTRVIENEEKKSKEIWLRAYIDFLEKCLKDELTRGTEALKNRQKEFRDAILLGFMLGSIFGLMLAEILFILIPNQ